jgi:hypothetical protein
VSGHSATRLVTSARSPYAARIPVHGTPFNGAVRYSALLAAKRYINGKRVDRRTILNYSPNTFFPFGRWSAQEQEHRRRLARTTGRTSIGVATTQQRQALT